MQALRNWDYYGMTETFTDLYDKSVKQQSFSHLYDIITSRENILLAYRTIESERERLMEVLNIKIESVNTREGVPAAWCSFKDPYGNRIGLYQEL